MPPPLLYFSAFFPLVGGEPIGFEARIGGARQGEAAKIFCLFVFVFCCLFTLVFVGFLVFVCF